MAANAISNVARSRFLIVKFGINSSKRHMRTVKASEKATNSTMKNNKTIEIDLETVQALKPRIKRGNRDLIVTSENQFRRIADTVTPLWQIQYSEQLNVKFKNAKNAMENLGAKLKETKCGVKFHCGTQQLPCPVERVRPSPKVNNYRNKDEFSLRPGVDGNPKTVGFYVGSPAVGNEVCVPADHLINIKESHKKVASLFQNYIRTSSWPICADFMNGGHWRNVIVRSNEKDDVMAIIKIHPQSLSQNEIDEEKDKIKKYFNEGEGKLGNLTSLYFQACPGVRCTHQQAPYELLSGVPYIFEELSGLKLRVSPDSFTQVNTKAAEVLYSTIEEIGQFNSNHTLLDICCGTGVISLTLASKVKQTYGVELIKDAVEDAKFNADLNNISNAKFYDGRAEMVFPEIAKEFDRNDKFIAVVNPGRGGLHKNVTEFLRRNNNILKVIYVSCLAEGQAMQDFVSLCSPKLKARSVWPFQPKLVIPVDMFPHTRHCELVILFERK